MLGIVLEGRDPRFFGTNVGGLDAKRERKLMTSVWWKLKLGPAYLFCTKILPSLKIAFSLSFKVRSDVASEANGSKGGVSLEFYKHTRISSPSFQLMEWDSRFVYAWIELNERRIKSIFGDGAQLRSLSAALVEARDYSLASRSEGPTRTEPFQLPAHRREE